jgi:hypothetical protein
MSGAGDVVDDWGTDEPLPDDLVIPLGPGLQVGLWWNPDGATSAEILDLECCTCA